MGSPKEDRVTKKNLGETVLGWFVVREDEDGEPVEEAAEPEPPAAAPVAKLGPQFKRKPPPPLPDDSAPPSVRLQGNVPQVVAGAAPDPKVFGQVFKAAQITDEAQQRVDKALALLQSL